MSPVSVEQVAEAMLQLVKETTARRASRPWTSPRR